MIPKTARTPAKVWIEVLKRTMSVLSDSAANDVILFGSQAMSVYSKRALASKDLDLIVPEITLNILEELSNRLIFEPEKKPTFDFQVSEYVGRRYPVGHIYIKHRSGFPIVIELFQTFLGYETTRLTPFLVFKDRWGMRAQVLVPEAIVGARLAFRPPERISRFNAVRLNTFIRSLGKNLDWRKVNRFIDAFQLRPLIIENLAELASKNIRILNSSEVARRPEVCKQKLSLR